MGKTNPIQWVKRGLDEGWWECRDDPISVTEKCVRKSVCVCVCVGRLGEESANRHQRLLEVAGGRRLWTV